MPGDFGDRSFDGVRVLKDHGSLGGDVLVVVGLNGFASEVFFKQVDLVVLAG